MKHAGAGARRSILPAFGGRDLRPHVVHGNTAPAGDRHSRRRWGRILAGLPGSVFARVLAQLALGVIAGVGITALLEEASKGGLVGRPALVFVPVTVVVMLGVGLLAVIGPAARGLRIQPTEALREE